MSIIEIVVAVLFSPITAWLACSLVIVRKNKEMKRKNIKNNFWKQVKK